MIHVAVARHRAMLVEPDGVRIHHLAHLDERALWNVSPPRLRYEEAALDVACRAASEFDAIAVLANACQSRRTTAARLLRTLTLANGFAAGAGYGRYLIDIAEGTYSVLEHAYLNRVERAHGLPRATRQNRSASSVGVCYRDTEYGQRLVVELDGRLFHDSASARDRDFERDLDAAVEAGRPSDLSYQPGARPSCHSREDAQVMRGHGIEVSGHAMWAGTSPSVSPLGLAASERRFVQLHHEIADTHRDLTLAAIVGSTSRAKNCAAATFP